MSFQIRNFKPEQFELATKWCELEQWNPGLYDYQAVKHIYKDHFWMGTLDGQPIAMLAAIQYDQNYSFVGWYMVRPEYRGKGYGIQVWKKALSTLNSKNVALEAVLAQQHNYIKSGFKSYHKTIRHQGPGTNQNYTSQNLVDPQKIKFEQLSSYDRKCFPALRQTWLKNWLNLTQSKSIAYVNNDKIQGYGSIRLSADGYRIGPLYADNIEVASQIYRYLVGCVPKQKSVFLDVPQINQEALKLAQKNNLNPGFTCLRMYTNGMPDVDLKGIYGCCSLQFG